MTRIHAKKSLGQNFLVDRNVLRHIVESAQINPDDLILEIGPGKGALTELLAGTAKQVVAVELDDRLVTYLQDKFRDVDNVQVVAGDILRTDLNRLLAPYGVGRWKVVANLPYNISSQVLFLFLEYRQLFSQLVLMLQKEVGERLVAPAGCKDYGVLSVFCQIYFDISRVLLVKPGSFRPIPKVDSLVLKFSPLPVPRVVVGDEPFFRKIVKAAFAQRRKTLWNCLRSAALGVDEMKLERAMREGGIDPGRRGETLSLEEFAHLGRIVRRFMPGDVCSSGILPEKNDHS